MEEKNWLKELVNSSDFEYFDGEDYEVVAGQGKMGQRVNNYKVVAGQGKGQPTTARLSRDMVAKEVVYEAVPITAPVEKKVLQASANPFNNPASYNRVSSVFFDIIVETKLTEVNEKQPDVEVPILYPYMNHPGQYNKVLERYGLILGDYDIVYYDNACKVFRKSDETNKSDDVNINIKGMSFNLSDLYNAILYRNLKLQINKIRYALQEPDDIAYLNALTMYSIGITSKIQKDSLNAGSFVRPYNFNNNIVDVDMEIVVDYNNILTYTIDPGIVNLDADGNGQNTFRMSFFCNILK